eukprot:jgi/Bigna1/137874/aug1.41_g12582
MSKVAKDQYRWCQDRNMYITQEDLLKRGLKNVVVVDVRDDDGRGGKITGSLHLEDSLFDEKSVQVILKKAEQIIQDRKENSGDKPVDVIFHCMESARRGPRCARRLFEALDVLETDETQKIRILVLQGGFDQWIRKFFKTRRELIEDYDDEYWGYEELQDRPEQKHSLYERPEDQPKTPWSEAGSIKATKKEKE